MRLQELLEGLPDAPLPAGPIGDALRSVPSLSLDNTRAKLVWAEKLVQDLRAHLEDATRAEADSNGSDTTTDAASSSDDVVEEVWDDNGSASDQSQNERHEDLR